jgi:hypothetical protein
MAKDLKVWTFSIIAPEMIQLFMSFAVYDIVESTASAFDGGRSHGLHIIFTGWEKISWKTLNN